MLSGKQMKMEMKKSTLTNGLQSLELEVIKISNKKNIELFLASAKGAL